MAALEHEMTGLRQRTLRRQLSRQDDMIKIGDESIERTEEGTLGIGARLNLTDSN
jgi:hypothetical protein